MSATAPERTETEARDDGVKWLAFLLRDGLLMIVRGIESRYAIHAKQECPRCGWRA